MTKTYKMGKQKYLQNKKRPYEKYRYGAVSHVKDHSTHGHGGYYRTSADE